MCMCRLDPYTKFDELRVDEEGQVVPFEFEGLVSQILRESVGMVAKGQFKGRESVLVIYCGDREPAPDRACEKKLYLRILTNEPSQDVHSLGDMYEKVVQEMSLEEMNHYLKAGINKGLEEIEYLDELQKSALTSAFGEEYGGVSDEESTKEQTRDAGTEQKDIKAADNLRTKDQKDYKG
ncbi:hypothetical protein AYI68_g3053 [Smittium mucronatum]|uniref:Uncharacterized protein n=1 Tax=Smittium mucronatum TaxID=133383 RepID=A0A1R0H0Z6_9FUNG|nr:hypothetical protein AYI68_g3053 [Smittium mucronatum]